MDWNTVIYLVPYVLSCAISGSIAVYAWTRQRVPGSVAFGWLSFGEAFWTVGATLEILSPGLNAKVFWDAVQWLGTFPLVIALPTFVTQYLDYKIKYQKRFLGILAIVPILMTGLVFTDHFHRLIYPDPHIVAKEPFASLEYSFTPVVWAYSIYNYIIVFGCLLILLNGFLRPHGLYRLQIATIAFGVAFPILGTILTLVGIDLGPQRDITPYTFAIGNLVIAWGLFQYRLFDIIPIARDSVVENLSDPVIVLDIENRIIDINLAGLRNIGKKAADVIGRHSDEIYASWPDLIKRFRDAKQEKTEITLEINATTYYYEISISPLYNRRELLIGRVFVVRDITEQTRLKQGLLRSNTWLEERVRERTGELAKAYDTTLQGWAKALELRDKETEGHSRRVTDMTIILARAMKIPEADLLHIRRGALLHDIGKMAVPDEILRKNGDLTESEKEIVSQHPLIAYELLAPIPYLKRALDIPYCHHEHWDGSGYPRGLKGEKIPLAARIFTIIDVWDALLSDRPYRKAWSKEKTREYMKTQAGVIFDPKVLGVFLDLDGKGEI